MNDKQQVDWLASSEPKIINLNSIASQVSRLSRKQSEIELGHDFLEIQSAEYARRFEALVERERSLNLYIDSSGLTDVVGTSDKTDLL